MTAIILDTETTGLREPEPCEIAYIRLSEEPVDYFNSSDGLLARQLEIFQSRFMVSKPFEPGATAIHGISHTDLVGQPHWTSFRLPETTYIIGHKIDYDARVLRASPDYKYICTCNLARLLWPELPNHKLTTVIESKFPTVGKKLTADAHGALVDCKLCLLILETAINEFEGMDTWEDMYQMAGTVLRTSRITPPKEISVMPFGKHKGKKFSEIPTDYLRWLINKAEMSSAKLKLRVAKELETR